MSADWSKGVEELVQAWQSDPLNARAAFLADRDYLVGLDHGTLAFQGEKDEVLDRFRMVQGPGELLTPETRGLFLGWEQSALGFTALTDRPQEAEALLGQEARYRRPTIGELIIYRGGNVQ